LGAGGLEVGEVVQIGKAGLVQIASTMGAEDDGLLQRTSTD